MPRLKTWTQEYPGGPWRTQCGGYLLEAGEAGRSLADLAAAGEDGPSWAVRRAGLGTMGDPTAGQVAGDIADSLEAAQDLAELEVIRLLANDANVRALLVGMWLSPDEVERLNHQMLDLLAIADALGVPERERSKGIASTVKRAQAEWRGAREALAETRAALHNREAECEAHKARVAELEAELATARDTILAAREIHMTPGRCHIEMEGEAVHLWLELIAKMMMPAPNYIESRIEVGDSRDGYVLTMKRNSGKTPHELRVQAEQERDAARANLDGMIDDHQRVTASLRAEITRHSVRAEQAGARVAELQAELDAADKVARRLGLGLMRFDGPLSARLAAHEAKNAPWEPGNPPTMDEIVTYTEELRRWLDLYLGEDRTTGHKITVTLGEEHALVEVAIVPVEQGGYVIQAGPSEQLTTALAALAPWVKHEGHPQHGEEGSRYLLPLWAPLWAKVQGRFDANALISDALATRPVWIPVVDGQIPPGRWQVWDDSLRRAFAATVDADGVRIYRPKGAFNLDRITHYCAAPTGPGTPTWAGGAS